MHWLCIAAFILLIEPKEYLGAARKLTYRVILLITGLTSVTATFMLPCYLLKAWKTKSREEWIHFAILLTTAFIQFCVFISVVRTDVGVSQRFAVNESSLLGASLFHFVYPFTSQSFFDLQAVFKFDYRLVKMLIAFIGPPSFPWPRPSELILSITIIFLFILSVWRGRHELDIVLVAGSFVMVTLFSVLLSMKMVSSPRYALAPSFMLLTLFTSELRLRRRISEKTGYLLVLGIFLIFSPLDFRNNACFNPEFPKWREELRIWRKDNNYKVRVWPQESYNHWEMRLESK